MSSEKYRAIQSMRKRVIRFQSLFFKIECSNLPVKDILGHWERRACQKCEIHKKVWVRISH